MCQNLKLIALILVALTAAEAKGEPAQNVSLVSGEEPTQNSVTWMYRHHPEDCLCPLGTRCTGCTGEVCTCCSRQSSVSITTPPQAPKAQMIMGGQRYEYYHHFPPMNGMIHEYRPVSNFSTTTRFTPRRFAPRGGRFSSGPSCGLGG